MSGSQIVCDRCESPVEAGDLRCAICGQSVPHAAESDEVVTVEVYRCQGCGASLDFSEVAGTPRCSFCDSELVLERALDPVEQSRGFLPFTVNEVEARSALREWLGNQGFFRPPDLAAEARLQSLQPLYWVAWVFDAWALISWTADSNAGSLRSSWAPHSGQVEMEFDDILVSASRGLEEDETTRLARHYDLETVEPEPRDADNSVLERFDVQRSQARRRILNSIDAVARARIADSHIPGDRHRKLKVSALLKRLVTRRYSFPAYVLSYRYRDRAYRAVVCGQNARTVIGSAPVSWLRVLLAVALVLLGLAAVAVVVGIASS